MKKELLFKVFTECLEGEKDGAGAFLSEKSPGLFTFMENLSADEANKPVAGASIAAHVRHVSLCIDLYIQAMNENKRTNEVYWSGGWDETPFKDDEWTEFRSVLRIQMAEFKDALNTTESDNSDYAALGLLSHTAFHLGVIHVKYDQLKK